MVENLVEKCLKIFVDTMSNTDTMYTDNQIPINTWKLLNNLCPIFR